MISKISLLILTDHNSHSPENSLYGIVNAMLRSGHFSSVAVASLGHSQNQAFFKSKNPYSLFVNKIDRAIEFPIFAGDIQLTPANLSEFDIIFLRLPRPLDPEFFEFLSNVFIEKRIINRPSGILKTGSKEYLLNFQQFTPRIKLCVSLDEINQVANTFEVVLKPIDGYGGNGIIRVNKMEDKVWFGEDQADFKEFLIQYERNPQTYLAMEFLPGVTEGDKRIIVVNGKILSASLRIPKKGSWICNVSQGGLAVDAEANEREIEMIRFINPILQKEGIFYYGLDTLQNIYGERMISELNTASIGGITPAENRTGKKLSDEFVSLFIDHCKSKL